MRTIKTILILCVVLFFATSCKKDIDMTLLQKTVLENTIIRQIEVSDAWEVTIIVDSNAYVEIEFSAYLEPYLKTKLEGTQLEIGFTGKVYPASNSVFRAIVHVDQLERVDIEDAASVSFSGIVEGQNLLVELGDASVCGGLSFIGDHCEFKLEEASKLLDFQFNGISCKAVVHDASQFNGQIHAADLLDIELNDKSRFVNKGGNTAEATVKVMDASLLNMAETLVNEMNVELSGVSEATVWVNGLIMGNLTGASTLYYKGNPQIQINIDDSSEIIPL